jgi:hypothetical protein
MKFILYLMLFITPAANLSTAEKKQGYKDISKHLWTLQAVTQTEYPTHEACMLAGKQIVQNVGPVMSLTVMGWCICAKTGAQDDGSNQPDKSCATGADTSNLTVQDFLSKNKIQQKNLPVGFTPLPAFDPSLSR